MPLAALAPLGIITVALGVGGYALYLIPFLTRGEVRAVPSHRMGTQRARLSSERARSPSRAWRHATTRTFGPGSRPIAALPALPARTGRARGVGTPPHTPQPPPPHSHAPPTPTQRKRIVRTRWQEAMWDRDASIKQHFGQS